MDEDNVTLEKNDVGGGIAMIIASVSWWLLYF